MIRVFPRKTNATPNDSKVYFGGPELWEYDGGDRDVKISCTFIFDKPKTEFLAKQWDSAGYHVSVGGPAYDDRGGEFVPGRFLKKELVITSRGCNNNCWFCKVREREGKLRELEIKDGWDILDNNLLQCSKNHINRVFDMLNRQKRIINGRRAGVKFTGGLEAFVLQDWHVDLIANLQPKPEILYFAYDTPDDYEPLRRAAYKMKEIGFNNQRIGCYVLIGWPAGENRPADTMGKAKKRLQQVIDLNMMPYAMLYADQNKNPDPEWTRFQRQYVRPALIRKKHKGQFGRGLTCKAGQGCY